MQRRRPLTIQPDDLATRRLRLISDIMEDYQENMRRMLRLLEMELVLDETTNNQALNRANDRVHNVSEWVREQTDANTSLFHNLPRYEPLRLRQNRRHNLNPTPIQRFHFFNQEVDRSIRAGYNNEEISQVTETMPYTESMGEIRCPITWDNITLGQDVVRLRGCGHMFSSDAIYEWFQRNRRCPVCRAYPTRVTTTSVSSQNNNSEDEPMPRSPLENNTVLLSTTMQFDPSGQIFSPFANSPFFRFASETPAINESIAPPSSPASASPSRSLTTPINSLFEGIVSALTDAISENAVEREFTFNLNDLLEVANTMPRRSRDQPPQS